MKFQSPWMGRVKGSAGNMTGCKVYDKNVMRAKAFEVNNPNTVAQQVQRGYFAELTKLVAGFTPDQLRTLFPSKPKAMSRRNALAKQLSEYYRKNESEKVVDIASIDTLGNAPTGQLPELVFVELDGNINFSFIPDEDRYEDFINTIPVIVAINETKEEITLGLSNDTYSAGSTGIKAPASWEADDFITGFLLLTNTNIQDADFGSFIIKVRPEKKSN